MKWFDIVLLDGYIYLKQLIASWQPLKYYFLVLGEDECPRPIWAMISDQENEMSPVDEPTISEIYIYFVHSFIPFLKKFY